MTIDEVIIKQETLNFLKVALAMVRVSRNINI
jgi:hypothetical protein